MHRAVCIFVLAAAAPLGAQINVLTYQYDLTRAGANRNETTLTHADVNATQFGKLFSYPVDGYLYAQPLYLGGVTIPGKGTHNVVYAVTEHDSVYAFDADSNTGANSAPLWVVSFLNAAAGVTTVPASDTACGQITPEIGITSTPVIDPRTNTLYVVAMTKEATGGTASYVQRLHALDAASGAERPGSPVAIQATYPGTGEGGTTLTFNPKNYKQRPGLLLLNGVVYTAWSSHCDIGRYHGWLIGYDAQTLQQVSVYNSTPNGNQGSFWAGGAAPAVDASGNIYLVSGNGAFDYFTGGPDLGESFIKLSTAGGLAVSDYFTPFNYSVLNNSDLDTGSSGVVLLGDEAGSTAHPHLLASAGKEGRVYLLDRDNLGKVQAGSDSQIVQSIPGAVGALFGNPAYFNQTVYFCGSGDTLKAYSVANAQMSAKPVSQSTAKFSGSGCVPTVSANGLADGIVWVFDPAGLLRAYDAGNLATELFDSNQNRTRDALDATVKFTAPAVANGKVYAGTQTSLAVYGLLAPVSGTVGGISNAASGDASAMGPGSLASIYGSSLAGAVTVNGVAAPVLYSSARQINFQIPFETAVGQAAVSVAGASAGITVKAVAPGLFLQAGGNAAVLNQDSSVNSSAQPAASGSVVAAYLTGLGAVTPPVATGTPAPLGPLSRVTGSVTATVGGVAATIQFAGLAPTYIGLYQVNIVVPALPGGSYLLQVSVNGVSSNAAPINVR